MLLKKLNMYFKKREQNFQAKMAKKGGILEGYLLTIYVLTIIILWFFLNVFICAFTPGQLSLSFHISLLVSVF